VTQFQIRESTDIHQSQGLVVLAEVRQPKIAVGALVILEVFDGLVGRIQVNIKLVIESLTRILDL
jgi:hypothetical protein